ncbi:hypothetical protein [Faecalibacillus faecis]|uniref:hypothetical protein n=1 Tax=Faecalibacillus faecis TaxID=1982628 RepID=UPI0038671B33
MPRITEKIVEPSKIYVGSTFKLRVKVSDDYSFKKSLITESGLIIITENKDKIRTEWGE